MSRIGIRIAALSGEEVEVMSSKGEDIAPAESRGSNEEVLNHECPAIHGGQCRPGRAQSPDCLIGPVALPMACAALLEVVTWSPPEDVADQC